MVSVLIMGLPNSGKTTLAKALRGHLGAQLYNADVVREMANDWDFSYSGRLRQAKRMRDLCKSSSANYVIADFVAPLDEFRNLFSADWIVWVDTLLESRFEDTNKMFTQPSHYDFRITEKNAEKWALFIASYIKENKRRPEFDWTKDTVQMLGRWQPWHTGHRALFDRAVQKTGQVVIQVRGCCGTNSNNPFDFKTVKDFIDRDLEPLYQGQYVVQRVPNVTNITYGRKVGYTIEQEFFNEDIQSVSGTEIRKSMGVSICL